MAADVQHSPPPPPELKSIPIDLIDRNPHQPRQTFDPDKLSALAESLKHQGQAQPIVLRPKGTRFELIAGERRWRAAQHAGMQEIYAVIRAYSDVEAAEVALAENELRVNLNPIETARAAQALIDRYGHTHDDLALILGIERPTVSNLLRLLTLHPEVQACIGEGEGKITIGHAKWLLSLQHSQQRTLAARVVREGLAVRQLERLIKQTITEPAAAVQRKDPNITRLEDRLTDHLGQRCVLDWSEKSGGGDLKIHFTTVDELEGFLQKVGVRGEG